MKKLILAVLLTVSLVLPAAAQTKSVTAGVVGGTITQWDSKKIVIRGVDDEWTLYLDASKTMMMGHPSVDNPALVWFARGADGNLMATRVYVPQTEMWPTSNILFPGAGQVKGTVTKVSSNNIVLRAGGAEWSFAQDGKSTVTQGTPQVDGTATVWYHKADDGTMYAKKIQAMP